MAGTTPRERATHHIHEALKTGIRGEARSLLNEALQVLTIGSGRKSPTDLEYKALKPGQKMTDPARAGLLMRCGSRTGSVWFFRHQHPQTFKQVEVKMGSYPADLTVSEARALWDEMRQARSTGIDPATVLNAGSGTQSPMTVAELCERYVEEYAKPTKRSWAEDERLLRKHLVPVFGSLPATKFTHKEAAQLLSGIHKAGNARLAEKVRAVISTMYAVAAGRTRKINTLDGTWLPPTTDNPVQNVVLPKHTAQNYKPKFSELAAFMQATETVAQGDLLRILAQTMCRVNEVAAMTWAELDLDEGRWTLPASRAKNGHEHLILLAPQSIDLLRRIRDDQAARRIRSDFVFPQKSDWSKPVSRHTAGHAWAKVRATLGMSDDFVLHSLRHAALTWAGEHQCPREVRDRLTNHVSGGGIDAVYNAATLNAPAKEWWAKWADHLDLLTQPNVVEMPGPKKAQAERA